MGKITATLAQGFLLAIIVPILLAQASPEQIADHQKAAQQAEARDDFKTAVEEYQLLAHWLPKSAEVQSNLGVALYFHHEFEKAADASRRAIALNQSLYAPHLFLGLALARLSRPDAAASELEKGIAIKGDDPLAHLWLGYEYTSQSRYGAAAEQLEVAGREDAANPDTEYALGKCYLELGNAAIKQLFNVAPDGGRTWQLAGEQFEAQGNSGKALRAYIGALQRRPDVESLRAKIVALGGTPPESDRRVAGSNEQEDAAFEQVRQYEQKARAAFERVSHIDPDSYRAHQIQADSDIAADRVDDAIQEYKMVLQRNPDLPGIHAALCNALSRTGQVQDALKQCDAEIGVAPFSAEAYVEAARMRLQVGEDAEAGVLLEKALKLDRPPIVVYRLLGKLYLNQKQYQAATKALSKYLAVETKDSNAYYLLARACKYSGDTRGMNQAIAAYKKTSDIFKNASYAQQALDTARHEDDAPAEESDKVR